MKKIITFTMVMAAVVLTMTSCGGSSASGSDAMLFGKVPGIVANFNNKSADLKEQAKASRGDAKKQREEYDNLFEKTRSEVESAAQAWSGSTIPLESNDEWTVKAPVTVAFDGFPSKSSLSVRYNLSGEVVVAKDIQLDENNSVGFNDGTFPSLHVMLKGYDAEGNEVSSTKIGLVARTRTDNGVIVAAGTPIKWETLNMNSKHPEEYINIKSLKLAIYFLK